MVLITRRIALCLCKSASGFARLKWQHFNTFLQEMLKARDLGEVVTSVGGLQEQLHELHERCNRHMKEIDSLRSQLKAKGNAPEPAPQIQEQQDEGVEASGVPGTESCSSEQLVHISRDLRHVRSAYMEIAEVSGVY